MDYDQKKGRGSRKPAGDRRQKTSGSGVGERRGKPRFAKGGPGAENAKAARPAARRPEEKRKAVPKPVAEEPKEQDDSIHGEYENGAVIGRSAVRELLKSERPIDKILVQKGERTGSITVLVAQAIARKIPVIEVERQKLDNVSGYAPHQGIVAMAAEKEYCTVADILAIAKERGEAPLLVICDGVTDPYNLGAIIRCAECCGAHGLIIPKRRAAGLTPLVTKASAGAIEHLAIAKVPNIAAAIAELKEAGIWVYAAEAGGSELWKTDLTGACAIVMGSEGDGVSPVVKKACDGIVSIPIYGKVNSFNVSTAAAVILAEAARQHHKEV